MLLKSSIKRLFICNPVKFEFLFFILNKASYPPIESFKTMSELTISFLEGIYIDIILV